MTLLSILDGLDMGTLIQVGAIVGGYFAFKSEVSTKIKNLEKRDEEKTQWIQRVEGTIKLVDDRVDEVSKTADATADYASKSEGDRKKVMEKFLPNLTSSIEGVNKTLSSVLAQLTDMKKDIQEMKEQRHQDKLEKEKFYASNPELVRPDES